MTTHMTPFAAHPIRPYKAGSRKTLPGDLKARQLILRQTKLPDRCKSYLDLRRAFEDACPALDLTPSAQQLWLLLFKHTSQQDWVDGNVVIVWPSNELLMSKLRIGEKTLKTAFRQLRHLGLIAFKDSPTKVRYGRRENGMIDQANSFGIILNPIMGLYEQFCRLAEELTIARRYRKQVRRNWTSHRRHMEELLIRAWEVLEDDMCQTFEAEFSALRERFAQSRSDFTLKEALIIELDALKQALESEMSTLEGNDTDDSLQSLSADELERMKAYILNKPTTEGNNNPPIRPITEFSPSISNRLGCEGRRGEGGLQSRLDRIKRMGEQEKAGNVHKYQPKDLSFEQVRVCLPHSLKNEVRPDHGWYQLQELLEERCREYGVRLDTFRMALATMGQKHACAALVVVIAKHATLNAPDNYLASLIHRFRGRELRIERSLFGIIHRKKAKPTAIEQLRFDEMAS